MCCEDKSKPKQCRRFCSRPCLAVDGFLPPSSTLAAQCARMASAMHGSGERPASIRTALDVRASAGKSGIALYLG